MRRAGPLGLTLAVLLAGPAVTPAAAQQPGCGQVVTQSVQLTQSLRCPDSDGLVVGAHGITINLGGHVIHQGIGVRGSGTAIDNSGGYDGVTIRNGSLGADGLGIRLAGASATRIIDVSASGGGSAIGIEGGEGNQILRGEMRGFSGIDVSGSQAVRITNVDVSTSQSTGIRLAGSSGVIAHNTLTGAIAVEGNGNRVTDNVVVGALNNGISILSGADNLVARNWVVNTRPAFSPSEVSGDGIHVAAFTAGTIIRGNIAVGNDEDGIDVEGVSARLVANLANDNTDLGIEARPGTSASGNQASGNGNPAQCAGIACG
jgi:hypothetical protein